MDISVIIPTHNPHTGRLRRALAGLRAQDFPSGNWETIIVDNASSPPVDHRLHRDVSPEDIHLIAEPTPGLTHARRRGFETARGDLIVLVDDDNVLAPDYFSNVRNFFNEHARVGAVGGRSVPEFETVPPAWMREFDGLIACRDLGDVPLVSNGLQPDGVAERSYPVFAPIGAGMAVRREAIQSWLKAPLAERPSDRRGDELTSGGDNDIVLSVMEAGFEAAYSPALKLTHLIPSARVQPEYLARLNRGIAKSWVQVLARHSACPWSAVPASSVPLRKAKAWFAYRAWSGPAARIRWQGACGHFEGLASLNH